VDKTNNNTTMAIQNSDQPTDCVCKSYSSLNEENCTKENTRKSASMFLDPTELFQEEHAGIRQPLTGFSRSYVEFPCAVNNPNTTVELLDDSGHGNFIPVPVSRPNATVIPLDC